ncbi:hypothetical protein JCM3765_001200 [Sporobolomyces pararoseus]
MTERIAPTDRTKHTGECVVCGTQTSKLCSSYLKAGTPMYFCSVDHQKLVYFAHKRICGRHGNPFLWPWFTHEEIDRFKYLASKPLLPSGSGLIPFTEFNPGPSIEPFAADYVDFLEEDDAYAGDPRDNTLLSYFRAVAFHLESEYRNISGPGSATQQLKLGREQPFNLFAVFVRRLPISLFKHETLEEYSSWSSRLQHLLLIMLALSMQEQGQSDPRLAELVAFAYNRVLKFCQEVIFGTHPSEALLLINSLLDGKLEEKINAASLNGEECEPASRPSRHSRTSLEEDLRPMASTLDHPKTAETINSYHESLAKQLHSIETNPITPELPRLRNASSLSEKEGRCIVCNMKTFLRCRDCAKYGVDYLFFCGIECKRLVFSMHKRVCGVRSQPFEWPGLSNEEIRQVVELSKKPLRNTEGGVSAWIDRFSRHVGGVNVEERFRADFERCREAKRGERSNNLEETARVFQLREVIHNTAIAAGNYEAGEKMTPKEKEIYALKSWPWNFMYKFMEMLLPDLPLRMDAYAPWATRLHHFYVILTSLLVHYWSDPTQSANMAPLVTNVRTQLRKFAQEIRKTHEREGCRILGNVDNYPIGRIDWAIKGP